MKKFIVFFLIFLGLISFESKATHIYGADFYYAHISGNTYKVTLAVYGDCSGAAFPNLPNGMPQVYLFNGSNIKDSTTLILTGPGVEVTPVCPADANNTSCKLVGATIPGVTRFIYSNTITIPTPSANWLLRFTGAMGGTNVAGRSNSITNVYIDPVNGSEMVLEAQLNNLTAGNSSPNFTTIPTPFYCVNIPEQYNQGAIDPDNDSLVYSLVSGITTASQYTTSLVSYLPPYTPTNPLSTSVPLTFSSLTGQLSFTPDQVQRSLVVNQVTEYRNGVIVGTAMREMTFVVLANCNTQPASGTIDTTSSTHIGGLVSGTVFTICKNTPFTQFQITPINPSNDTVTISVTGQPLGSAAAFINNSTPHPTVNFTWVSSALVPGDYIFYVTFKTSTCPLTSSQTQAFTVHVVDLSQMTTTILAPTQCVHKALVAFNFTGGQLPRSVVITQFATTVLSFIDSTGQHIDSLGTGSYVATITGPNLACQSQIPFTILDSGVYPFPPITAPVFYCKDALADSLGAIAVLNGKLNWYDINGNHLSATPFPNTAIAGIFPFLVSQTYKVCESVKDTVLLYITKRPVAAFGISNKNLCNTDTAIFTSLSTVGVGPIIAYNWAWSGAASVKGTDPGPWHVSWNKGGVKIITLQVLENECPSDVVMDSLRVKETPGAAFHVQEICQHDSMHVFYDTVAINGQTYNWDFDGAQIPQSDSSGPFQLHWNAPGVKHISLITEVEGCIDSLAQDVLVKPNPIAQILNQPMSMCVGEKIQLEASGGGTYRWLPAGLVYTDSGGKIYTQVINPTTYTVVVTNEYNCEDSTSITFNELEPCCKFSYPNAFSPNGDGLNDRWKVLMYGNPVSYKLSIYNRWGQRVFYTFDPNFGWDGNFAGKPCDIGTYFYYLQAECFTGHKEDKTGDVLLIR